MFSIFTVSEKKPKPSSIIPFLLNCRGLLDKEEMTKLRTALQSDEGILKHHYSVDDGTGRKVEISFNKLNNFEEDW